MSGDLGPKTGGCLCGAVRYRALGPFRPVVACHCEQCRRTSGHHVAATSVPRHSIEIHGGVTWYESSPTARRAFCPICGSNLFWDGQGENLSIFAGTLDDATGLSVAGHIYCADKGAYYELPDGIPRAEADDPNLTTRVP